MGVKLKNKVETYHIYGGAKGSEHFYEMVDWCRDNLQKGWWSDQFPFITFEREKDYMHFLLVWS